MLNIAYTDSNGKSLFDGVWFGVTLSSSLIATLSTLWSGVVGGIQNFLKSVDRVMMKFITVFSNIPLLIVIVLTYSIGAGFWLIFAMSVTTWIGIYIRIRIQNHALPWLRIQPCFSNTWNTQPLKSSLNIMPQLVSVIVSTMTPDVAKLHLYEAFLPSWLGLPVPVPSLGTFDLRLLTKRYDQRLLILDSIDNLGSCIPISFVAGQNLWMLVIHVHIDRERHDKRK